VLSVTSETALSASTAPSSRASRPDPSGARDDFSALIDSTAAETPGNDRPTVTAPGRPSPQQRVDDVSKAPDSGPCNVTFPDQGVATSLPPELSAVPGVADLGADAAAGLAKAVTAKPVTVKTAKDSAADMVAASDLAGPADADASLAAATTAATPVAVAIAIPTVAADAVSVSISPATTAQPLAIAAAAIATSTSTIDASKPVTTISAQIPADHATAAAARPTPAVGTTAMAVPATAAATTLDAATPQNTVTPQNAATLQTTVSDPAQAAAVETIAAPVSQSAIKPDPAVQADPEPAAVSAEIPIATVPAKVASKAASAARSSEGAAQGNTAGAIDDGDLSSTAKSPDPGGKSIAPQAPVTARNEKPGGIAIETANPDAGKPDATGPSDAAASSHQRHAPAAVQLQADAAELGQIANTVQQPAQPAPTSTPAPQLSVTASNTGAVPLNGLALQIALTAQSGRSRFEIRLDPAELGRIDVRIDLDRHGQITSHLTVEKPETLAMLRQDAPQLQRALDAAGFRTADGGLQFSLRDQSSSGQNSGNEAGRNVHRLIISEDDAIPVTIAGRSYGRTPGSGGGVDIRV
jgi:flagellar hook-length control protein FliK